MADYIKFYFGKASEFKVLEPKVENALYFITDKSEIYKGETLIANANVIFTSEKPENDSMKDGSLYVYTDESGKTSLLVKGETEPTEVGGGKASEYEPGSVTFEAFNQDMIATSISEDAASSEKLVTESAVQQYVDGVKSTLTDAIKATLTDKIIVGVQTGEPSDGSSDSKIGLHFSVKKKNAEETGYDDDTEVVIDLDKEKFLSSAKLINDGKTLELTMNNNDKVEIDLAQIVADATTVKTKEAIDVQLGDNGSLGGYKTGDTIIAGTSVEQVLKKLLAKQVPPTYTKPTITVANNGGRAAGNIEIGTKITPNIKATFTQNDAGKLTNIQFKKGAENVGEAQTSSPAEYTEVEFALATATTFTAVATYEEGAVKQDNLGEDYPTGHIAAGDVISNSYTFTPYRQGYFWGVLDTDKSVALTSEIIRAGTMKNGAYAAGDIGSSSAPVIKASAVVDPKRIFVACPSDKKGVTKVTMPSAMNADATKDFVKGDQVDVEGADGYQSTKYNVWVYEPAKISSDQTFVVTLG